MTRSNFGKVGRRSGGAWQWVLMGAIGGFACAVIVLLAAVVAGYVQFGGQSIANLPTATAQVVVITATAAPTDPPTNTSPAPTVGALVAPSATNPPPTPDVNQLTPSASPTQTPTLTPTLGTGGVSAQNVAGDSSVPPELLAVRSEVVEVSGGTFTMGTDLTEINAAVNDCRVRDNGACDPSYATDAIPAHQVTVNPFRMETTEVSYAQYIAFLNSRTAGMGPSSHLTGCQGQLCVATQTENENSVITFDSANYGVRNLVVLEQPVVLVTWYGAAAYCEAIGRRLPTESEWERAARGDDGRNYPWGNIWDSSLAKVREPGSTIGSLPVTSFPAGASPYGVLNMAGNVGEWTADWYAETWYSQQAQLGRPILNPTGPVAGTSRVVRGGSWDHFPFFARTTHRLLEQPDAVDPWLGFRCVEDTDAPAADAGTGAAPGLGTPDPATLGVSTPAPTTGSGVNNGAPTLALPPEGDAPLATLSP